MVAKILLGAILRFIENNPKLVEELIEQVFLWVSEEIKKANEKNAQLNLNIPKINNG